MAREKEGEREGEREMEREKDRHRDGERWRERWTERERRREKRRRRRRERERETDRGRKKRGTEKCTKQRNILYLATYTEECTKTYCSMNVNISTIEMRIFEMLSKAEGSRKYHKPRCSG